MKTTFKNLGVSVRHLESVVADPVVVSTAQIGPVGGHVSGIGAGPGVPWVRVERGPTLFARDTGGRDGYALSRSPPADVRGSGPGSMGGKGESGHANVQEVR